MNMQAALIQFSGLHFFKDMEIEMEGLLRKKSSRGSRRRREGNVGAFDQNTLYMCREMSNKDKVFLKISEIILIRLKSIKSVYPVSLFGFQTMQGKRLLVKGTDHISLTT